MLLLILPLLQLLQPADMKVDRDLFYRIASDLPAERLEAVIALVKNLEVLPLPEGNQEWSYVLNRLVNGLASNRNSARLGFSLCLTEVVNLALLKKPECLDNIDTYLDWIINGTDDKKPKKGKDERSLLFAKLFGLQITLSDPIFEKIFISDDQVSLNLPFLNKFIDSLIDLAMSKNWLREPTLYTIYQLLEKLNMKFIDTNFIKMLLTKLDQHNLTMTCEGLAIYLFLWENKFNLSNLDIQFNNVHWKKNNPLAKGNLPFLMNVLKNVSVDDNNNNNQNSSNWSPRLHFVWDILLNSLFNTINEPAYKKAKKNKKKNNDNKPNKEYIQFPEFWQSVIDESFFNEKVSSERKYLGFNVFIKILPLIPISDIDFIFTRNLMRTIVNQSNDNKRQLHKISQKLLNSLIETCTQDSTKIVPFVDNILFSQFGSINFDRLTKSKTISKLLSLQGSNLTLLFKCFTDKLSKQSETTDKNMTRFILDSCLHIIRNHKSFLQDETKSIIMEPLLAPIIANSFFHAFNDTSITELYHEKLYSILSELSIVPTNDSHSWQYYTIISILCLQKDKSLTLNLNFDDKLSSELEKATVFLQKLSNREDIASRGLEALLTMSILQLFMGDMDSLDTIEELCNFQNENAMSLVGITEILLGFLAQKKSILTKTALLVWEQFITKIGSDELNLLLDVLTTRENKQGFAQLFEGADEFEIVDDKDEDDFEDEHLMNSDSSDNESDGSDNSSSDDDDEGSSSDDDEDDKTKNIDKETTSALVKALNLPENIIDENGEVKFDEMEELSDDDDENEESMDDEQMMALDDQLSQIFKHRKDALSSVTTGHKRKLEVKDSRESVIAFKHKIIDMLTIYIKYVEKIDSDDEVDKLNNLISFFEPMIKCVQITLDRPLVEKIAKLIKSKIIKIKSIKLNDVDKVWSILNRIHTEYLLSSKPGQHSNVFFSICSSISIYLSKILVENDTTDKETYEKLIDMYAGTMKKWLTEGKVGVNPFIDFINWLSSKRQV